MEAQAVGTAQDVAAEEKVTALLWARNFLETFGANVRTLWTETRSPVSKAVLAFGVALAAPVALALSGLLGVAGAVRVGTAYVWSLRGAPSLPCAYASPPPPHAPRGTLLCRHTGTPTCNQALSPTRLPSLGVWAAIHPQGGVWGEVRRGHREATGVRGAHHRPSASNIQALHMWSGLEAADHGQHFRRGDYFSCAVREGVHLAGRGRGRGRQGDKGASAHPSHFLVRTQSSNTFSL